MINLALNKFGDDMYKPIRTWLKNTHENFVVILNYNMFTTGKK